MLWALFQALKCTVGWQVTECSSTCGFSNTDVHCLIKRESSLGPACAEAAGSLARQCYQEPRLCQPPAQRCLCVMRGDGCPRLPGNILTSEDRREAGQETSPLSFYQGRISFLEVFS